MKLGRAFSDNVIIEKTKQTRFPHESKTSWWLGAGRALLFATLLLVLFFVLSVRLFDLTVIEGHRYRALADDNRTRELVHHAPRGIFYDRTGLPLVENIPEFRLLKPCEGTTTNVCTTHIGQDEGERLRKQQLPAGWFLEVDYVRRYLLGNALAHVVGYTGEISGTEIVKPYYSVRNYHAGDRIGRMGAEEVFEEKLRGRDGKELVEVDAQGRILRTLGRDPEDPGESITLSLDAELSHVGADAFPAGYKGAIIVSKPSTGEILALYSSPAFDPNGFSKGLSSGQYSGLINNPDMPLFDRAIGGVYPPGSTFKIVTAIGALEEGAITRTTTVEDTGIITIGPFQFPNWYFNQYGKTEGIVDIVKAIQRSNDIYFYKTGEWLGITKLASWARKIGIGKPLGIELSGEASGNFPDPAWKEKTFTSPADLEARDNLWYLGDTYHVAIGQGYLLVTPLQVNAWTNVIANGGKLCRPTIEKETSDKKQVTSHCKDLGIKKETIQLITEGMEKACETGGTGWPLFNFQINKSTNPPARLDSAKQTGEAGMQSENISEASPSSLITHNPSPITIHIPLACKTGTAEFGDPKNRTHAWFTVFGPLPKEFVGDNTVNSPSGEPQQAITGEPEISVTVLVEEGGEGSSVAAPIAKKILENWFSR